MGHLKRKLFYTLGAILLALSVLGILLFIGDYLRWLRWTRLSLDIRIGSSKSDVIGLMGKPIIETEEGHNPLWEKVVETHTRADGATVLPEDLPESAFIDPETWIYGRRLNLKDAFQPDPPYFWPVVFRLAPNSDDVVVKFDHDGNVQLVLRPNGN